MQPAACVDPAVEQLQIMKHLLPPPADVPGAVVGRCIPWHSMPEPDTAAAMRGGVAVAGAHVDFLVAQQHTPSQYYWQPMPGQLPGVHPLSQDSMPPQQVGPVTSSSPRDAATACEEVNAGALAYCAGFPPLPGSSAQHVEGQRWQPLAPPQSRQRQAPYQQGSAGRQQHLLHGTLTGLSVSGHPHYGHMPAVASSVMTASKAAAAAAGNQGSTPTAAAVGGAGPAAAAEAVGGTTDDSESSILLATAQGRMAQLTPDWPPELRLATLEALLLEQQLHQAQPQCQGNGGDAVAHGGGRGLLAANLGCRIPISCTALSCVAHDLPDAAYLAAARQLQEELQACWINGVTLPSIGGNFLLPAHTQMAAGTSTSGPLVVLNPYYTPCEDSGNSSCSGVTLQAAARTPAINSGNVAPSTVLQQLPGATSEALTFALLGAWCAAPKLTCLLSTAGGAAAAAVAAAADARQAQQGSIEQGAASACQQQLPEQLLQWAAAGGAVAIVAGSLAQLACHSHLSSTAGGLLAVTPGAGVDFGTNQVVLVQQTPPARQQGKQQQQQQQEALQQPNRKDDIRINRNTNRAAIRHGSHSSRSSSCSNGSSSQTVPREPVVRELTITNIHATKDVVLLNVCLAPEYDEWVSLWDPLGIAGHPEHHMQQAKQCLLQRQRQHSATAEPAAGPARECAACAPAAVLLPPSASYTVQVALATSSTRKPSQAELGVISQICVITAAAATAASGTSAAGSSANHDAALHLRSATNTGIKETFSSSSSSSSKGSSSLPALPAGWQAVVCGVPVAGGLVSQLADLQSVLRADAKPFVSAALRQLFVSPPSPGRQLAFLAAPTDLGWDVPMGRWHEYNGLAFLGERQQPGLVPAAQVAHCTLKRFKAMMGAASGTAGAHSGQAPLLSWGPPVLQQWQRLLLLEEGACERDMASYSLYNVRLAAAVFNPANHSGGGTAKGARLRRYAICPWPTPPDADAEMFTYRGPNLAALLGPGRTPRLAVISVPGLPENRPGLVTGDVVYVRLASGINSQAHQAILAELPEAIRIATKAYKRHQSVEKHSREKAALAGAQSSTNLQDANQLLHEVSALHVLLSQLESKPAGWLEVEAAGLVAAVDGSRCLLVMPDAFWLLLRLLHEYDTRTNAVSRRKKAPTGSWGTAAAAALPLLVHACFCFDRTGQGRMQALLPYLAASPRLLLPPGLLTGTSAGAAVSSSSTTGTAASAASAVITNELVEAGGIAVPHKQEQVLSVASSLQLAGGVPLNHHQRVAVASLVCGGGVVAPYVLFGPPGTGKTVTLVEAVLQYRRAFPRARLLCCAPANYSADLLCSALARAGITPAEMLRLNDPRRPLVQAKTDTLPFCVVTSSLDCFNLEEGLKAAAVRPIVICSTITAGLLLPKPRKSAAIPIIAPGAQPTNVWQLQQQQRQLSPAVQFDLVVVDEAGQGLAPEVLLPLSLAKPGAAAMLAGDPRQLGPVLRSATAAAAGLGVSLLDSWIQFWHSACPQLAAAHEQQQQSEGVRPAAAAAPRPIAMCYGMLNDNYRSHKRLLDLPSRLFYGGALRAKAAAAAVAPPPWSELMAPAGAAEQAADSSASLEPAAPSVREGDDDLSGLCPSSMLFVGVNGEQRQDGDAPSYYNPQEVLVLAELLASLLGTPAAGAGGGAAQAAVAVNDIGVIATYRRQVQKIRLLLRQRGLGAVRVGTVDDYQGQEERIIFISTTLSKPESLPPPLPDVSALQQQQQHGLSVAATGAGGHLHSSSDLLGGMSDVGFWRNPKRFNVAITRAKALLVVVGSPRVLAADDNWRQLLRHCAARGAYRGAGSSYLHQLLRVEATPAGGNLLQELHLTHATAAAATNGHQDSEQQRGSAAGMSSALDGLLGDDGCGDDDTQLALAVQAIAAAAQLGMGTAEQIYPQTLDEYYAACADEQPWKVAL